jgi:LuxR family transcriptional regulator, maltose regulon positive regulatory protein
MISSNLSRTSPASLAFAAAGANHVGLGLLRGAQRELAYALYLRRRVPGISVWATIDIMLLLIRVLVDLGDGSSAAALIGEAGRLLAASPGDAYALQTRLEQLERRLADRRPALALTDPLTPRELTVLRMLRSTLPLREVAASLNLSVNTIKTQVQSIYRKLGVSARRDAIARGQQLGIL